jgi:hypothetical protein
MDLAAGLILLLSIHDPFGNRLVLNTLVGGLPRAERITREQRMTHGAR